MQKLFYFSLFFLIFYIEPIKIFDIKIAVLWKLIFLGAVVFYLLLQTKLIINRFIIFAYLYAVKSIFTISFFYYGIFPFVEVLKYTIFPTMFLFFKSISNKNPRLYSATYLNKFLAISIILSIIPFQLGLIESLSKGYDLSIYGLDQYGFIGIFLNPHGASITIAYALIILFFNAINTKDVKYRLIFTFLILIGFYALFDTYVRTGVVILSVGFLYIFHNNVKLSFRLNIYFVGAIVFFFIYYFYSLSDVALMRLNDTNIYSDGISSIGSGRFAFAFAAIINWIDSGFLGIMLGMGKELSMNLMYEAIGLKIYAHNGFIDVLQFNGILGFIIYIIFVVSLFRYISRFKNSSQYILAMALSISFVLSMLFQGEYYFLHSVMHALSIVSLGQCRRLI
jgi:hypothetical protein